MITILCQAFYDYSKRNPTGVHFQAINMRVTLITTYAIGFLSVADALPPSELSNALTRRAPEDDPSDLDLNMTLKDSLGKAQ